MKAIAPKLISPPPDFFVVNVVVIYDASLALYLQLFA
jgi:hypothetical protein